MPREYESYSSLSRFEQCPLSYKLHYIDAAIGEPTTDALELGTEVHESLRERVANRSQWLPPRDGEAHELAVTGAAMMDAASLSEHPVKFIAEAPFEFELRSGQRLRGSIDLVICDKKTATVVDYKTSRRLYTQKQLDEAWQLGLYSWAVKMGDAEGVPQVSAVRTEYWMLRHGATQVSEVAADTAVEWANDLSYAIYEAEKTNDYPAKPNDLCGWCSQRANCPSFQGLIKDPVKPSLPKTESIEQIALEREQVQNKIKALTSVKNDYDARLKKHVEKHGDLQSDGVTYTIYNVRDVAYDAGKVAAAIAKLLGTTPELVVSEIASTSKTALAEYLGKYLSKPQVDMLLCEFEAESEVKTSKRLWAKRAK